MEKIKDWFFFTSGERRGVCVLLCLIGVLAAARVALARVSGASPVPPQAVAADTASVTSLLAGTASDRQSRPPRAAVYKAYRKYEDRALRVELNTADTLLLTELRGIGPAFARRIVSYRQRLGGFYRPEQLLEVYGFTDELYGKIAPNVWADASLIVPLAVNELGIAQLKRHPYVTYYEAKAIYERRMSMPGRRLADWSSLEGLPDITPDFRERMEAYLSFD